MSYFWVTKKVHWSDTDAAGIVWFPNFFGWFEDAEEEIYTATLGRTRQSLLDEFRFGLPRVEATARYRSPVRAGETIRVGISCTLENARRLRHDFAMRADGGRLLASGFVRVACVDLSSFTPRDLPEPVLEMVRLLPEAAARQDAGASVPWV